MKSYCGVGVICKQFLHRLYQEIAKIIQDELNGRAVAISKGNGKVRAGVTSFH